MISANNLIFPYPRRQKANVDDVLLIQVCMRQYLQQNLIYIPKSKAVTSCFCSLIPTEMHSSTAKQNISNLSTARTTRTNTNHRIYQSNIQSSIQLKLRNVINSIQQTHQPTQSLHPSFQKHTHSQPKISLQIHPDSQHNQYSSNSQHQILQRKSISSIEEFQPIRKKSIHVLSHNNVQNNKVKLKIHGIRNYVYEKKYSKNQFNKWKKLQDLQESLISQEIKTNSIPCLLYLSKKQKDKIMLYFHGNGEDLFGCKTFVQNLSNYLGLSILAIEFPGYSIYQGDPTAQKIESDAVDVVEYLVKVGFEHEDVMIIGRSIGSGPALTIASLYKIGGVVLLSPFLSLCEAVEDLYGKLASSLLVQRFDNKAKATNVTCPCLLVHGLKDTLIHEKHSIELSKYFKGSCSIKLVQDMSHSLFCHQDFFQAVQEFIIDTKYV